MLPDVLSGIDICLSQSLNATHHTIVQFSGHYYDWWIAYIIAVDNRQYLICWSHYWDTAYTDLIKRSYCASSQSLLRHKCSSLMYAMLTIDSVPSLGVYYFLSLTRVCLYVCLSVCHGWTNFKLILLLFVFLCNRAILVVSSPWPPLQNVLRFLLRNAL